MTRPIPSVAGLGVLGGIGKGMVVGLTFEPTIGIVAGRIDRLGLKIRSFREPLNIAIREVMIPSIAKNFESGGRPTWAPLSEITLANRQRQGTGNQILVATGRLQRAATQINIWEVGMISAVIKDLPEDAWYGKVHQAGLNKGSNVVHETKRKGIKTAQEIMKGGKIGTSGSIPARPFFVIQTEDVEAVELVFLNWLEMRIAREWG